jgi:hypothetical protein
MSRYTILGNGRLNEEGAVHFLFAGGAKRVHLLAVMKMFQEDRKIFAPPDPAVVDIDLTTDMKRALITENYGVQKTLIVLYPTGSL